MERALKAKAGPQVDSADLVGELLFEITAVNDVAGLGQISFSLQDTRQVAL
jgi:hypothetical protein